MLTYDARSQTLTYTDEHCRIERWALAMEADEYILYSSAATWMVNGSIPSA
jgi:hypothetical protein